MTITEKPNEQFYTPLANNFVIRVTEPTSAFLEVTIDDIKKFIYYPFAGSYYLNLAENLRAYYLDSLNLLKGFRSKIVLKTFVNGSLTPIDTKTYYYTLLPFGVNYGGDPVGKLDVPTSGDFIAGETKIVRFGSLPVGVYKYDVNGALSLLSSGVTIVDREELCNGVYLRFLNDRAGFSYWQFTQGVKSVTTEDLGDLFNDYESFYNTFAPEIHRGKNSREKITTTTGVLSKWEQKIVNPILTSPLVEYWNGSKWLQVKIAANETQISTEKNESIEYQITIIFPINNNITL